MNKALRSVCMSLARVLPRGGYPLMRMCARHDPELQNYRVALRLLPGSTMLVDLRETIAFPLFKHGCYPHQLPEDRITQKLLQPGEVVWDIGANIGYTAILYSSLVGGVGHVLAVEPSPRTFAQLQRATQGLRNVSLKQVAIGDTIGTCRFHDEEHSDLSRIADPGAPGFDVELLTLDSLLEAGHRAPTFLKVDVEGHEAGVFSGAKELIARHLPAIEFEAWNPQALSGSMALLNSLSSQRYRYFRCGHEANLVPIDAAGTNNYYALRIDDPRAAQLGAGRA